MSTNSDDASASYLDLVDGASKPLPNKTADEKDYGCDGMPLRDIWRDMFPFTAKDWALSSFKIGRFLLGVAMLVITGGLLILFLPAGIFAVLILVAIFGATRKTNRAN